MALGTHLPPIWFRTNFWAPIVLANAPAICGIECPLAVAFSMTVSKVLLDFESIPCGICASVASWTRSDGEGLVHRGIMTDGSLVSPSTTILRFGKMHSRKTKPRHGSNGRAARPWKNKRRNYRPLWAIGPASIAISAERLCSLLILCHNPSSEQIMSRPATSLTCMTSGGSHGVFASSLVRSSCTTYLSLVLVKVILRMLRTNARIPAGP